MTTETMIKEMFFLADGTRIDVAVYWAGWNGGDTYIRGTATLREVRCPDETVTAKVRVSLANDRFHAVAVNGIELYDPPAAFLDHLPHRHRAYDDEGDCYIDVKPCPTLRPSAQFIERVAKMIDDEHARYRAKIVAGEVTPEEFFAGAEGVRVRPAYDLLAEVEFELQTMRNPTERFAAVRARAVETLEKN